MEQQTEKHIEVLNNDTIENALKLYYKPLVSYAFSILKNKDDAEDVVQQVFTLLLNKKQEVTIEISLRAYLYKAVYHNCLNKIKQEATRKNISLETNNFEGNIKVSNEISQHQELEKIIEKSISQLPTQCEKIFRMSRYEELKYQQIADSLGLSIKTVENQMGKALKLMRESLKDFLVVLIFLVYY